MKKLTKKEFIEKAKKVHGDKYDYSKVVFNGTKVKVEIICRKHGSFFQTPANHLIGHGCKECMVEDRTLKAKNDFLKKAREKYGDKYDYSKMNYINSETKIKIICPKHGEFEQTPYYHLKHGCGKCISDGKRKTQEQFISEITEIYKDKDYDFSKIKYEGANSKIIVGCPIHGDFITTPHSMLTYKCGCPKCNGGVRYSLSNFLEKARKVHGDKYDYSESEYNSCQDKVKIICPEHGVFYQKAYVHLAGSGCPKCVNTFKLEQQVSLYLKEQNIVFYEQYSWDWLKYINTQRVDFYLPDFNAVIECQGLQHFDEKNIFNNHSRNKLKVQQEKDQNKLELCRAHGINVFYYSNLSTKFKTFEYPYEVFEDLEQLLEVIKSTV